MQKSLIMGRPDRRRLFHAQ